MFNFYDYFHDNLIIKCLPGQDTEFRFEVYEKPFTYTSDFAKETISVPVGFKTDFASVPRFFTRLLPKVGKYNEAAIVHDYLCYLAKKDMYDRNKADKIFLEASEILGVDRHIRILMYSGISLYTKLMT